MGVMLALGLSLKKMMKSIFVVKYESEGIKEVIKNDIAPMRLVIAHVYCHVGKITSKTTFGGYLDGFE